MDTRLLKIFSAVAKHGGLPAASRELHLTSSALSHGLKALEAQLGARLFDRVGKRLMLNQAGEQLLSQIGEPLAALERAASSIKALSKWGQGRIRVGAPETLCQHVLPAVIHQLHARFEKTFIVVECGETPYLLQLLRQHRIDLALELAPENASDLNAIPLFEDELLFALSDQHPWADGRPVSVPEIARQPLILFGRGSPSTLMIHRFFQEQEIELTSIMEIANIAAIRALVKLNVGVAVLAPWVLDLELTADAVRMRPLGSKALRRRWTVLHPAHRRLGLAEEEFIRLCRAHVASLRLDRRSLPTASLVRPKSTILSPTPTANDSI